MRRLRDFDIADLPALYAVSLATGDAGQDASHLHTDGRLIGHLYSAPYAELTPEFVIVTEDEHGVAGYVLGALDTEAWEARLERDWWPGLRRLYADPGATPSPSWTADQRRIFAIHHPGRSPREVTSSFPAHVHMNLLPRLQGRGMGPELLAAWLARAAGRGATAAHVGVNRGNTRGAKFWAREGFTDIPAMTSAQGRTLWMGRQIV